MPRKATICSLWVSGLILLGLPPRPVLGSPLEHFEDATLRAIHFVDAELGWAVGDAGVIWHTIDGGQNWERQSSGVRASLRSVYFHDPFNGWVVGREDVPGGTSSTGVLLYTMDGGVKWQRVLMGALPGLHAIHFVDAKTGYLLGEGGDVYPTGVFRTNDSGFTWKPLSGPRCPSWLAGGFTREGGVLAGSWNRLALVKKGRVSVLEHDPLGGRNLRGLHRFANGAVAVGQGGLVLFNQGQDPSRWHFVRLGLPPGLQASWDFHAVHGVGHHLWAVGRPGSIALHSPDLGRSWELVHTGQPLPLHAIHFLDDKTGWAAGELGTILATGDGGKTWRVQRRGGQRAAVLAIHARPEDVPLGSVALLGGEKGYLSVGLCLTGPDPRVAPAEQAAAPDRFGEAFRQAGGTSAEMLWQFPLPSHLSRASRADLLAAWQKVHGGRAPEQLLRQLVLALRMWRPAVILTDDPSGSAGDVEALVAEAVSEACRQASNPKAFPEQVEQMGLSVWQPYKVYAISPEERKATVSQDLQQILPRLRTTPREFVRVPSALLNPDKSTIPTQIAFSWLMGARGTKGHRTLMEGVNLSGGSGARRTLGPPSEITQEQRRQVRRRAQLLGLVERPPSELTDPTRTLSLLEPTFKDMSEEQAAPAVHAIANHYAHTGQWSLAREAFLFMTDRYPTHPLTLDAYRWLIRHNASSEARRRHELGQFCVIGQLEVGQPGAGAPQPLPPSLQENKQASAVQQASYNMGILANSATGEESREGSASRDKPPGYRLPEIPHVENKQQQQVMIRTGGSHVWQWNQASLAVASRLAPFGPLAEKDPTIQFCLQAARRNLGQGDKAREWFRQFAARQPQGPWRRAAEAELWLLGRGGSPPGPVLKCPATTSEPFLDGKFDDACWSQGTWARLENAAGATRAEFTTEVQLAHDRGFLYLAVRCQHPEGMHKEVLARRVRDTNLRGQDRISVLLDLDRDYTTCCHLQVDQRGAVAESCWGDQTWNPRWFVAVHSTAQGWTVEAAFPLGALTGNAVTPGQVWAANVVRVLPGKGVQAWSLPAEVPEDRLHPEGMSLLMFTQGANQR
jgi:photosystem II stability/assembly factor-like uncharacterized protein